MHRDYDYKRHDFKIGTTVEVYDDGGFYDMYDDFFKLQQSHGRDMSMYKYDFYTGGRMGLPIGKPMTIVGYGLHKRMPVIVFVLRHNITHGIYLYDLLGHKDSVKIIGQSESSYHCDFCSCPKDIWKPMDSYQSDRSCEFYDDVSDAAGMLEEMNGYVAFDELLKVCNGLKNDYPDIPVFEAAIQECFNSYDDLGIYKVKGGKTIGTHQQ